MLHVITGGSGSGKSAYAENWLLEQREKNLYDENSEIRIRLRHSILRR